MIPSKIESVAVMDERQPKPPPTPRALEESMRELTLEDDGRPDPAPPSRSPESMMMVDIDDGRRQHGNNVVLPQERPSQTLPAGGGVGHGQEMTAAARAGVRSLEAILLEMLPEGSVLLAYTHNGYIFA